MPADAKEFSGLKIRGWLDGYFIANRNTPERATVDANQGASVVKGRDISLEGRTFDVRDRRATLSLAEIEIEKIPERGGFGFKVDLAWGATQDLINDTIRGAGGSNSARYLQHASASYVAPVGSGLRLDFGKLVTHIGAETIESAKNLNYSRSFYYTYGIPFQDTGLRANYAWSEGFYTELYVLQGWNVVKDNNAGKTWGPSIGWTPLPRLSIVANYLRGPEQNNNTSNKRDLFDTQVTLGPFADRFTVGVNYDYGREPGVRWYGTTLYLRYKLSDRHEPVLRFEDYRDPQGFTTGVAQKLRSTTFTWNMKIAAPARSLVVVRPEVRYDRSSANFFSEDGNFRSRRAQLTYGVGATWIF